MNENFEEYRDLVQLMRAAPKLNASEGFTEKVITALPGRAPILQKMASYWIRLFHRVASPREVKQPAHLNPRECSFYFFITSFFYLVMGIVLMMGFNAIGSNMAALKWLKLQPQLTIGTAIWLLVLGMALIMDGNASVKIAKYGTLLYVFFAVFNGLLIRPYVQVPYAGAFVSGFVAAGSLMGVMLAVAVEKTELRT